MDTIRVEDLLSQASIFASEATKISSQLYEKFGGQTSYYATAESTNILQDLESTHETTKLVAMQKILALQTKHQDMVAMFPQVIKNIQTQNLELKRLIYIYLLNYCEKEPELTLLSINSFLKDLNDPNPFVRSVSLRVLCSIKVEIVLDVIVQALMTCKVDLSPIVRKACCISLPKVLLMNPSKKDLMVDILIAFLDDGVSYVVAAALKSMMLICPDRFDLLHKHYLKLVKMMRESIGSDQIIFINVLTKYSKLFFQNPTNLERVRWDKDFEKFIFECEYLLISRDPGVVLRIMNLFYDILDEKLLQAGSKSIIRLFSRPTFEHLLLLQCSLEYVKINPRPWQKYLSNFFCFSDDRNDIVVLKLSILEHLAIEENCSQIFEEFECYGKSKNEFLSTNTIAHWRRLAAKFPAIQNQTLLSMVQLLSAKNSELVGEIIVSIRRLLQEAKLKTSVSNDSLICYLVKIYQKIKSPLAKASILWLIGHHPTFKYTSDALRIALKTFCQEESIVKKQIFTVALLINVQNQSNFSKLALEYCLKLGKFDLDYDVRDHARIIQGLYNISVKDPKSTTTLMASLTKNGVFKDEQSKQSTNTN